MNVQLVEAQQSATPLGAVRVFGVTLVGVNATTGLKLLFTLALVLVVLAQRRLVLALTRWVLGTVSIWVTPQTNLTTGLGLISAGLAFALQQVILALAGYFVILRGDTFGIGDRITLGGVRGDVIRFGFIKTTIMEMGQPPSVSSADPAVGVNSRQYTGRLVTVTVTVTNGVIFKEPMYNYTREFPYIWEEIVVPVTYDADRIRAEQILLSAARTPARTHADQALATMRSRYAMADASLNPAVYWRITDNWLVLSLRFLAPGRGVREVKDRISRDVLGRLDGAGVGIASISSEV